MHAACLTWPFGAVLFKDILLMFFLSAFFDVVYVFLFWSYELSWVFYISSAFQSWNEANKKCNSCHLMWVHFGENASIFPATGLVWVCFSLRQFFSKPDLLSSWQEETPGLHLFQRKGWDRPPGNKIMDNKEPLKKKEDPIAKHQLESPVLIFLSVSHQETNHPWGWCKTPQASSLGWFVTSSVSPYQSYWYTSERCAPAWFWAGSLIVSKRLYALDWLKSFDHILSDFSLPPKFLLGTNCIFSTKKIPTGNFFVVGGWLVVGFFRSKTHGKTQLVPWGSRPWGNGRWCWTWWIRWQKMGNSTPLLASVGSENQVGWFFCGNFIRISVWFLRVLGVKLLIYQVPSKMHLETCI